MKAPASMVYNHRGEPLEYAGGMLSLEGETLRFTVGALERRKAFAHDWSTAMKDIRSVDSAHEDSAFGVRSLLGQRRLVVHVRDGSRVEFMLFRWRKWLAVLQVRT